MFDGSGMKAHKVKVWQFVQQLRLRVEGDGHSQQQIGQEDRKVEETRDSQYTIEMSRRKASGPDYSL